MEKASIINAARNRMPIIAKLFNSAFSIQALEFFFACSILSDLVDFNSLTIFKQKRCQSEQMQLNLNVFDFLISNLSQFLELKKNHWILRFYAVFLKKASFTEYYIKSSHMPIGDTRQI